MGVSAGIISHLLLAFSLLSSSVSLKPDRRSFPLSGSVFNQFLGSGWPKAAGNYTCKAAELLDQQAPVGCRWCYYGACNSWQTVVETFFFLHLSTWPYLRWCLGSWDHSHKYRPSSLLNVKITWILESTWVLDLPANYILGFFFLNRNKTYCALAYIHKKWPVLAKISMKQNKNAELLHEKLQLEQLVKAASNWKQGVLMEIDNFNSWQHCQSHLLWQQYCQVLPDLLCAIGMVTCLARHFNKSLLGNWHRWPILWHFWTLWTTDLWWNRAGDYVGNRKEKVHIDGLCSNHILECALGLSTPSYFILLWPLCRCWKCWLTSSCWQHH